MRCKSQILQDLKSDDFGSFLGHLDLKWPISGHGCFCQKMVIFDHLVWSFSEENLRFSSLKIWWFLGSEIHRQSEENLRFSSSKIERFSSFNFRKSGKSQIFQNWLLLEVWARSSKSLWASSRLLRSLRLGRSLRAVRSGLSSLVSSLTRRFWRLSKD